ncbi:MAG: 30S ribosomal protein S4 [Kofleriaceae bacterium]
MSRYTGPRLRVMRALGLDLPGLSRKSIERRPYPPGQHGSNPRRRQRRSPFKDRLQEKQKLRFYYGLTERELANVVDQASRRVGNTGELLIELLESRLDNVVFRAGLARTIPAARQLVGHGHVQVDGRRVDRPGYRLRPGQQVSLRARSRDLDVVATSLVEPVAVAPRWLAVDRDQRTATVTERPGPDAMLIHVDLRLIIEFYAQR